MSRKKGKKRNRARTTSSTISQHRLVGKKLLPPMLHMLPQQKMSFSSWTNNRLPELLWACLAASEIPRPELLRLFLEIAEKLGLARRSDSAFSASELTHTTLPDRPGDVEEIVSILRQHPQGIAALRPLMLFEDMPGWSQWREAISSEPADQDGLVLAKAVGVCLDHQSQQSTDVRWLTLMFKIGLGKVHMPKEMIDNLLRYVHLDPGDEQMKFIRPSIRAAEMAFRTASLDEPEVQSEWAKVFWSESFKRTDCIPDPTLRRGRPEDGVDNDALHKAWFEKQFELVERFTRYQTTSGVDAKCDAVFGLALYAGSVLLEVMLSNNRFGISGRLLLRTLVECRITLAYLLERDDAELWMRFRRFGAGQAKLALLKFDDAVSPPKFLSEDALANIANEDIYEEFLPVELGHWCDVDLRKMAEASKTKDDYDAFYGWSSAYVHGSWSAVRDACLVTCVNPLHRLHRMPGGAHRFLESVLEDAAGLFNRICGDVARAYPGESPTLVIPEQEQEGQILTTGQ